MVPSLVGTRQLQGITIAQVTAGAQHTACVSIDGSVYTWGSNQSTCEGTAGGQLGVGDRDDRLVPTLVMGKLEGKRAVHVAAGASHTVCAIANGSAYAWGANSFGQLGVAESAHQKLTKILRQNLQKLTAQVDSDSDDDFFVESEGESEDEPVEDSRLLPTLVGGELHNAAITQVAASNRFTLYLTMDGTVFSCGRNTCGQLGVGTQSAVAGPTLVGGKLEGKIVVQVTAGDGHAACVTADGLLFLWGANRSGQLGVQDKTQRNMPTMVGGQLSLDRATWNPALEPEAGKAVVQVAAGGTHTVCRTADGSVYAWGNGDSGQLGVGDQSSRWVPMTLGSL